MAIFNLGLTKEQKLLIYAIVGLVVFLGLLVFVIFPAIRPAGQTPVTLNFWGVFDSQESWQPYIQAFNAQNKNIFIRYVQKSPDTYEGDFLNALASGQAPDVMMINSTWLPKHGAKLAPLPESQMNLANFQSLFPDVVSQDLVSGSRIYAIPIWLDALTLIYNKDLFNTAGIAEAPKTWDEFVAAVQKLTKKDKFNNISLSGAAIGTANNVENAADIVGALMLQSGAKMINFTQQRATFNEGLASGYNPGEASLRFYTDFSNPRKTGYTWNSNFTGARDAFIAGKTAMIFDYALFIPEIQKKAPNLRMGFAPLPQPTDASRFVHFANYWPYAVPQASKHQTEAWKFLLFMTTQPIQESFARAFFRPAARRDLITTLASDPNLGVFESELLPAVSWYQIDNGKIKNIFNEMINNVALFGLDAATALNQAAQKATQLMAGM